MWKRLVLPVKAKWQVGLHLSPYALRLAEVRATDTVFVRKHETIPVPHGTLENCRVREQDMLAFELEKRVRERRWKGREAVLSIPLPLVVIRRLTVPRVPDKELRGLIEIEMENSLHLPFADPVFDYVKLPETHLQAAFSQREQEEGATTGLEKLHLLVVAAPRAAVQGYVDLARAAGLKPIAVDVEPLALFRVLQGAGSLSDRAGTMLLNLTLTGVDVAIFSSGIPEFFRHIPLPVPFYNELDPVESLELAKQAVRHLEANGRLEGYVHDLFTEITRITNFYQYSMHEGKQKVEQICLTGDFEDVNRLVPGLRERLSTPVYAGSYEQVESDDVTFSACSFAVAVGLGMKDVRNA